MSATETATAILHSALIWNCPNCLKQNVIPLPANGSEREAYGDYTSHGNGVVCVPLGVECRHCEEFFDDTEWPLSDPVYKALGYK